MSGARREGQALGSSGGGHIYPHPSSHVIIKETSEFTESFTSIPASVGAIVIGLRESTHGIDKNRELYERAAGASGVKTLSLSLGSLQLPIPAYQINFSDHQFGRLFADLLFFTGGSASNGVGGDSMTEFAKSPLVAFRVLQEPGAYASTAFVRTPLLVGWAGRRSCAWR